jgi:methylmalonyl-CoA mutase N-terminal domain/subunit
MVRAIEDGYLQGLIADEAFKIHQEIESGERPVVGVNMFVADEPPPEIATYELDAEGRDLQLKRLSKVKAERDPAAVKDALAALSRAAEGDDNAQADRLRQRLLHGRRDGLRAQSGMGRIPAAGGVLMSACAKKRGH